MPPFVSVSTGKNDFRDAEAFAESVQRPTVRFVATKTVEQLDLQALHRVHSRLVSECIAIVNESRAFLLDRGNAVAKCLRRLRVALPSIRPHAPTPFPRHLSSARLQWYRRRRHARSNILLRRALSRREQVGSVTHLDRLV